MYICNMYVGTLPLSECDESCCIPGSLSSIVMDTMLGETISTAPCWSVEVIATMKFSDSSVVLSSMVDTIKVAYISPAVKVTVYGPGV